MTKVETPKPTGRPRGLPVMPVLTRPTNDNHTAHPTEWAQVETPRSLRGIPVNPVLMRPKWR